MLNRVSKRARFCSPACKDRAHNEERRLATIANRSERSCAVCGTSIPAEADGRAKYCSVACNIKSQNRKHVQRKRELAMARRADRAPCAICGNAMPLTVKNGARYCSTDCLVVAQVRRRKVTMVPRFRLVHYGITPEQFAERLESQDGRCAICRTDTPGGKGGWHVDHDHETKAIRGLLCNNCNNGLGRFADDPVRLRGAVAYLERRM